MTVAMLHAFKLDAVWQLIVDPALSRPWAQHGVQGAGGSSSLHAITCHYMMTQ